MGWRQRTGALLVLVGTCGAAAAGPRRLADAALIECLSGRALAERACDLAEEEIRSRILRRRPVAALIAAWERGGADPGFQGRVLDLLYGIDDARVTRFMRRHASREPTAVAYYALNYLGKRGDRASLAVLNDNHGRYPVSSWQWAATVALFGRQRFRPAIPNLIRSLQAASLNVVAAADTALRGFYPCAPKTFPSPEARRTFFERARCPSR